MKYIKISRNLVNKSYYFFVYIFIITGCKSIDAPYIVTTKDIPGSEMETGGIKYSYVIVKYPSIKDPTCTLLINQSSEYRIKTQNGIKRNVNSNKIKYINGNDRIFYNNYIPVTDKRVSVSYKNISLSLFSDQKGQVSFDLINDFHLHQITENSPCIFKVVVGDTFIEPSLNLDPKSWLHYYAQIIKDQAKLYKSAISETNYIGYTKKGIIYEILTYDNVYQKYKLKLLPNKNGWINRSDVETFYSNSGDYYYPTAIKNFVQDSIVSWLKMKEFENPILYEERIKWKDLKIDRLLTTAMQFYQSNYIDLISWDDIRLSPYDEDNQTFQIYINDLNDSAIIHVPFTKAKRFKELWNYKIIKNQKFILVDGKWQLSRLEIEIPQMSYTARYDSELNDTYNPATQFSWDFSQLIISKPEIKITNPAMNDIDLDYDINYNLPLTNKLNYNGIAIVIGNSNYKYLSKVDYALNDAQLIKTYLKNVLGYLEGNIFFLPDATKSDLDLYFGSKQNYKGILYNNVVKNRSDVFIYFSGHGAPGIENHSGYLLPVDCNIDYLSILGYQLDDLYSNLSKLEASSVTVVLEACFSGANVYENISSVVIKPNQDVFNIRNGILLTSSSNNEVSSWFSAKKLSLFTYFFLKSIHDHKNSDLNSDGLLSFNEIFEYVSDKNTGVPYYARRLKAIQQNPFILGDKERIFVNLKDN